MINFAVLTANTPQRHIPAHTSAHCMYLHVYQVYDVPHVRAQSAPSSCNRRVQIGKKQRTARCCTWHKEDTWNLIRVDLL
ncbi:hypothetical protein HMPREF9248_0399 [Fannyhessea vaginae PB189-T1-4]|uniref:Uncharacterized protein n=1 Tax=Fannyhessea vaginae PB189-T1-4 TaxID=866774 RepID=A0ABN0B165_9ACTN|nr:hypothetical protein HMPREF9248_0399 [Fannyhessea vaginae PB189-T1-4]